MALGARLLAIHPNRVSFEGGGFVSYGVNYADLHRRAAEFADKIVRGAKPGDIPVQQPTKFEPVINVTVAKALGVTIPELGSLDRANVSHHGVRIVAVEPEHRHIFVAGQQSPANSSRELAQVGSSIQGSKARCGGMGAVTDCLNGMALAA